MRARDYSRSFRGVSPRNLPRVLDLTTGIPGAYAARLLAQAGSDVVRAEPRGGDPLRRWRWSDDDADGDGALFEYLRVGQRAVSFDGDPFGTGADIVLVSPRGDEVDGVRAGAAAHPDAIVVAITPYGLDGPYRDRPATDFTLQADSGALAIRGASDGPPVQMGGRTCEWLAGAYATFAALASWEGRRHGGRGALVDVSVAETNYVGGANFADVFHGLQFGPDADPQGPPRQWEIPSIERTKDGWVGFNTNAPHQLQAFLRMMGRDDLVETGEFTMAGQRIARAAEWNALVSEWTTKRTTDEIVELAVAHKVPVAPVCDGRSVAELEQVRARGTLVGAPSERFRMPGRPWRIDGDPGPPPSPAPGLPTAAVTEVAWRDGAGAPAAIAAGPAPGRSLEGLRVVDLTSWWAGPMSSALLAAFGADVIHVESPARMDGMRMVGAMFLDRPRWWEFSWFFLSINTNKRDLAIEIDDDRGRALVLDLVAHADVVVENATPRVLDKLGLGWDTIQSVNPRAILVRMPAFGLDGPWRERPGFAQTIEQASGLAWMTGRADDQPRIQRGPCDPNGGVHAAIALLTALEQRERTDRGCIVEASMFDAALAIAAEPIIEWSAYGNLVARDGNRSMIAAPQGLYACAGPDSWVAVSVETDDQWHALASVIERSDLAGDATLATRAGRRGAHDRLDDAIAAWASAREADEAADALAAAGVPAAIARDPRLAPRHPQFAARGFHEVVDHPAVGQIAVPTLPFRITGVDRWARTPAPSFGEHNDAVLGDLLGCTPDDLAKLRADAVIADRPAGS